MSSFDGKQTRPYKRMTFLFAIAKKRFLPRRIDQPSLEPVVAMLCMK